MTSNLSEKKKKGGSKKIVLRGEKFSSRYMAKRRKGTKPARGGKGVREEHFLGKDNKHLLRGSERA